VAVYGAEAEARVQLPRAMQLSAQGSMSRRKSSGDDVELTVNIPRWLAGLKFMAPLSVAGATFAARATLEGPRRMASPSPW
jgi:hypothetical protein